MKFNVMQLVMCLCEKLKSPINASKSKLDYCVKIPSLSQPLKYYKAVDFRLCFEIEFIF